MAAPTDGRGCHSEDVICEIEATVVTGFEQIAAIDARNKLKAKVEPGRGHIRIFLPYSQLQELPKLQSVDNYFIVINHFKDFKFADNEVDSLDQFVDLVPQITWSHGLSVWQKFFSFDHPIALTPQESWYPGISCEKDKRATAAKNEPTKGNAAGEAENKPTDNETGETTGCQSEDKSKTKGGGQYGDAQEVGKNSSNLSSESVDNQATSDIIPKIDNTEPPLKKKYVNPLMPNFRATCYRTGKTHKFGSMQAACAFGGAVQDYFGWNVNLTQHHIEVVLFVEPEEVYVALALTRESLHKRHVVSFGPTTLRPTIAYNMLAMCDIQAGDVVCDPMCGGGSIPIEAAINWPQAVHISGDIHPQAVPRAQENVAYLNKKRKDTNRRPLDIDLYRWDCTELPMKDASVDVFITDMPFGKRSGSRMSNWHLYPRTLQEMARVCKPRGRACLLTHDRKCIIKALKTLHKFWVWRSTTGINIGGLAAAVFFLYRTNTPVAGSTTNTEQKPTKDGASDTAT